MRAPSSELWKLEWWTGGYSGHVGQFQSEYVEGDAEAHTILMELTLDSILSLKNNHINQQKRRRRMLSWFRAHPIDNRSNTDSKHVDSIEAWRLTEGEWVKAKWRLTEPDIEVWFDGAE